MSTRMFFLVALAFFLGACGKQKNAKLGLDYYKMSTLELEEGCGYRRSLYYIDKALQQDEHPLYVARKATLLFLLGKEAESASYFKRALQLPMADGVRADVLNNYACLLAKRGDLPQALVMFEQLEGDKNYLTPEVALVNAAKIYYGRKNYREARRKLKRAIGIVSDYIDARYYLGLTCYAMNHFNEALREVEQILRLEPKHEGALALRKVLREINDY